MTPIAEIIDMAARKQIRQSEQWLIDCLGGDRRTVQIVALRGRLTHQRVKDTDVYALDGVDIIELGPVFVGKEYHSATCSHVMMSTRTCRQLVKVHLLNSRNPEFPEFSFATINDRNLAQPVG